MEAKVIIAIVVIVALIGHYWLYKWIKFKIDEGVVLKYLRDSTAAHTHATFSSEDIAASVLMTQERVTAVCARSKEIISEPTAPNTWSVKHG